VARRPLDKRILTQLHTEAPECIPFVLLNEKRYQTVLAKWQRYQREKREWTNQDMVNNVRREFKRHLKWAEIKPIGTLSIHTLRKCSGKNWADHLPPNVTKELMGHSNIATTMKYYSQVDKDQRKKAAAVVDALISRANRKRSQTGAEAKQLNQNDAQGQF
jgi:integrase